MAEEASGVPVLSAGKVGQEKGDGTCADFSILAVSGASTIRARPLPVEI
jgi:hypothetical protein